MHATKRSCLTTRRHGRCIRRGCAHHGRKPAQRAHLGSGGAAASAPDATDPSEYRDVSLSPTAAVILTVQATCLNLVAGLSATPLVCSVVGSGACAASDAAGAALPAQVAIPAVLVAAAAQAAGTGTLVASEFRGELLKQQQRLAASASGRAFQTTQGAPREPVTWQAAVAALGIRWSGGAAVWGVATAVVAAAAVATISLALAALSDAGAASGNTQALREVLLGADGGSGSGGGSLPLPLLAAALLLAECVLAPLAEELVFRRVLLCALAPAPAPVAGPAMVPAPAAHLGALELETAQVQQQEQQQQQPDSAAAPRPPASAAIAAAEAAASNAPAMPSAGSPPPASAGAEAGKGITAAPPPVLAWRPEWLGPLSLQAAAFAAYHLNPGEVLPQAALGGVLGLAYLASGRNLAVPLAGHALYNGAAVALLLLQP